MGIRTSKSFLALLVFAFIFSACRSNIPPATTTTPPERTVQPPSRYTTPQNTLTPPLPSPTRTLAIWTHPPLPTNTPPNTRTWTPFPTTVIPYVDIRPSLQPGTYMVYWLEQEYTYFIRSLQEPLALRLLPLTSIRLGADISPDGEWVAFVDMDQHLVVFDLTSGEATYIPQPFSFLLAGYIRWSPDGRQLLYMAMDRERDYQEAFYLVTPGEDDIVCITPWRGSKGAPNWSPDGQWIAFSSDHNKFQGEYPPRDKLYLLNTACISAPETCLSGLVPLGERFDEATRSPAWSPDGRRLAFTCTLDGQFGICVMNMDGSNLVQIYHRDGVDWWTYAIYGLHWSLDGETIAFTLADESEDPDPRNIDGYNHDLFIIPAGGGEAVNVSNTTYEDEYFAFWMVIR